MSRFFRREASSSSSSKEPNSETSSLKSQPPNRESQPHPNVCLRPDESVVIPPTTPPTPEEVETINRLRSYVENLIHSHYHRRDSSDQDQQDQQQQQQQQPVEPFYEEWEYRWLNYEENDTTVRRYLRAAKGNESDAMKRLESTLLWRRSFKPDIIPPESIRIEGETGKHLLTGFDNQGRSVLYLIPGRENTKSSDRQIRYTVWGLERAIDLLPPGQTKITLAIDFHNSTQATNPNMTTSLKILNILQNHYVERLGQALIIRPMWYMNIFWNTIQPFIDPVTKSKVKWNQDLTKLIPVQQCLKEYGGKNDFVFDREVTWKQILHFTGIDTDGTRVHECFSKVSPSEQKQIEEQIQQGTYKKPAYKPTTTTTPASTSGETNGTSSSAAAPVTNGNGIAANGHAEKQVDQRRLSSSSSSSMSSDDEPTFHDAQQVLSRSSASAVPSASAAGHPH
ncbi:unnamed protein product [Sympodiomycopsis kandeliae]